MTDCFPEVVLPPPAMEQQEYNQEQEEQAEEEQAVEQQGVPPSPVEEDYEDDSEEEVLPPALKKRARIPQEEIFNAPKVKTILFEEDPPKPLPKGRTKAGLGTRKKRGPATPEQLERLAKGREKAQETRIRKKKEREEQMITEKSDKELVKAVRAKEIERERKLLRKKLERSDDQEDDVPPKQPVIQIIEKDRIIEKGYSQEDLDDAVQRAVEQSVNRVEVLRKQRKEVKKKELAKAQHDAKVFQEVNRALKRDAWSDCFL